MQFHYPSTPYRDDVCDPIPHVEARVVDRYEEKRERIRALIYELAYRDRRRFFSGSHVNQRAVARAMGISESALSRYLAGRVRRATDDFLYGLQRYANCERRYDLEAMLERPRPTPPPGAFLAK